MDRKEETKIIKKALKGKYSNLRVRHGVGTAWGWLRVSINAPRPNDCYCNDTNWAKVRASEKSDDCRNCSKEIWRIYEKLGNELRELTGREGEYGGQINIDVSLI